MTTSKFFRAMLLPLLLPLAGLGCSGGGSSGPSTAADFCTQYAGAICQIATPCGITMDTCTAYQTRQCNAMATAAMTDGLRVYNPGNTGDCVNKVKAAYGSSNPITPSTMASIELACQYVFQGKGMVLKDQCTTQFDCAGTTNGSIICDQAHHLCASSKTVSGSQQCSDVGDVCATNFYCATDSTTSVSTCTAEGTSGAASDCTSAPCDSNSRCASGTCMPLVTAGGTCAANSDCASSAPYCDPFGSAATCDDGLRFSKGSPSCTCYGQGVGCPAGLGGGGQGGAPGTGGAAGSGVIGTGGAAGGGAAGNGAGGAAGNGAAGTGVNAGGAGGGAVKD